MTLQQIIESSKERDRNVQSGQQSAADIIHAAGGRFRDPVAPVPGSGGNGPIEKAFFSASDFDWNPGVTSYAKQKAIDKINGIESRIFDYQSAWDVAMRKESDAAEARRGEIIMSNLGKGLLVAGSLWAGGAAMGGVGGIEAGLGSALGSVGLPAMTLPEIALFGGAAYAGGKAIIGSGPELNGFAGSGLDFRGDMNFGGADEPRPEFSGAEAGTPISGGGGVSLAGSFGDFWGDIKGAIDRPALPAARHDDSILFEGMV